MAIAWLFDYKKRLLGKKCGFGKDNVHGLSCRIVRRQELNRPTSLNWFFKTGFTYMKLCLNGSDLWRDARGFRFLGDTVRTLM